MINPHNPDFITKVPWYLGESGPSLKHHNIQKVDHFLSLSEADALVKEKIAKQKEEKSIVKVSYKKGACKNCGAMTHKEKDCVER
jgi:pre-mRNA-processing factor SLU7